MVIKGFGIELHLLEQHHIELLRSWRNGDYVRNNMQHQDIITAEMQQRWFDSLQGTNSYYFMVYDASQRYVGCCNLKEIDPATGIGDLGVFYGDERFATGLGCPKGLFLLLDWAFREAGLQGATAIILQDNYSSQRLAKRLGFQWVESAGDVIRASLTEANFRAALHKHQAVLNRPTDRAAQSAPAG